jgi:hypothetical protein
MQKRETFTIGRMNGFFRRNDSPRGVIMRILPNMKNRAIREIFAIPPGLVPVAPTVRVVPSTERV